MRDTFRLGGHRHIDEVSVGERQQQHAGDDECAD